MSDSPSVPPQDGGRPQNLGTILRTARERKGLELSDVAEVTHVRKEYLLALEEGRYADLPEDVYSRNFLRLFAQAVGSDSGPLLEMYSRERSRGRSTQNGLGASPSAASGGGAGAGSASTPVGPAARREAAPTRASRGPTERRASEADRSTGSSEGADRGFAGLGTGSRSLRVPGMRIGSLLATLLLVAAVVAVALWAFNNLLFSPGRGAVQNPPVAESPGSQSPGIVVPPSGIPETTGSAAEGTPEATEQARDVLLTIESEPPGAEVTVDGFPLPGTTPVRDVPVTARASRLVRVTLDGYAPFESTYDLSFDRTLSVILEPVVEAAPEQPATSQPAQANGPLPTAAQGQIALAVTEATWLEVYASTARQQGERLVYTTAQPGDRFIFDLPVYVHVGNAAGLFVSVNGQDLGAFGSSGAVVGRAFTE